MSTTPKVRRRVVDATTAEAFLALPRVAGVGARWLFHGAGPGSDTAEAVALAEAAGVSLVAGACPLMFLEPVTGIHRLHRGVRRLRGAVTVRSDET